MKVAKNESLLGFMKNKISSKSIEENSNQTANLAIKKKDKFGEEIDKDKGLEKQKKLRVTKNESKFKASQFNQFEMYKRLIVNAMIGCIAIVGSAIIFIMAIIKIGPSLITLFNTLLYHFVMSSLRL